MLTKISWQEFISSIVFSALVYYVAIVLLYYRKDILKWSVNGIQINGMSKNVREINPIEETLSKKEMTVIESIGAKPNYGDVHELMEDLKTIFTNCARKKIMKQELIFAIGNRLQDYKQIKGTKVENEIILHIKNECNEKCSVELSDEELKTLWRP